MSKGEPEPLDGKLRGLDIDKYAIRSAVESFLVRDWITGCAVCYVCGKRVGTFSYHKTTSTTMTRALCMRCQAKIDFKDVFK